MEAEGAISLPEYGVGRSGRLPGPIIDAKYIDMGYALTENRNGVAVDGPASRATGSAERLVNEVVSLRRDAAEQAVALNFPRPLSCKDTIKAPTQAVFSAV